MQPVYERIRKSLECIYKHPITDEEVMAYVAHFEAWNSPSAKRERCRKALERIWGHPFSDKELDDAIAKFAAAPKHEAPGDWTQPEEEEEEDEEAKRRDLDTQAWILMAYGE